MSENIIKHEGIVCKVNNGIATIKLVNISACSSCHAKSACNVSEIDNKEIEVPMGNNPLTVGERINVLFNNAMGVKALFLGYVFPFIFMISALSITLSVTNSETIAGLTALGSLLPYYLVLALFRKKFQQTFSFRIEKLNVSI